MRKKRMFLCTLVLILLSSCSSGNTDPNEELYKILNKYMTKANVKCTVLLDAKEFEAHILYNESYFLTKSGKVYDLNIKGLLYSTTNENCAERGITKGKKVDSIYGQRYYIDGNFYVYNDISNKLEIDYDNSRLVERVRNYGIQLLSSFDLDIIVDTNKVLLRWPFEDVELPLIGIENGEVIIRAVNYYNQLYLLSNKSIFTFKYNVNQAECMKYADIKCADGFVKEEGQNRILNELKSITTYFDGYIFIDTKGDMYYLKGQIYD